MSRTRLNINRDWKFFRGDVVGAERPDFDDSQWQRVGLPHTFDLPYFRTPEFYVGVGWYRKRIHMRPFWRGKLRGSELQFEGAFQVAEVFIDGQRVGEHGGGYTAFTTKGPFRDESVIAIRVSNEWSPRLCPRAGEHIFSGGLYRDVYLAFPEGVGIPWHGINITTPHVSRDSAAVRVQTELRNQSPMRQRVTVRQTILDPDGSEVCSFESTKSLDANSTFVFDQSSAAIANPKLWHPDHPHLYTLRTEEFRDRPRGDAIESKFGFRWFEWTPDRGFFLNGEHLYLRGANAHQDHSGWGIAITQAACERDVRLIKEAGFNFVRGAHYPHHPAFADACDRLGLIFWSENAFWGKGGFGPEGYWNASAYPVNEEDFEPFEQSCKQQLVEMIRSNRNHPSIVAWSMTNEAFFTYNLDRAKKLMSDLVALSRETDPTRPAAIGGAQRGDVDHLGDIAGYNGDGARLFIDPGMPNMVSEYGAISKPHDAYDPFWGELQTERYPWRAGEAIWCAFDYGSIAGKQGLKGILRHDRLPKQSWHWYCNALRDIAPPPFPSPRIPRRLRLSADKTTIHDTNATDDCQLIVTIVDAENRHISNSPPVTLTIESGPGEFPTGRSITFDPATDIPILAGQAAIAFRSYEAGESLIRATSPGLADATITITTTGEPRFIEGVTPLVAPRPYTPPPESAAAKAAMRNAVNVALNRPSRASSEQSQHPARLANDGDVASSWRASEGSTTHWWQVDLEGFYQLSSLKLTFPRDGKWQFTVEFSLDAANWDLAIDRRTSTRADAVRNEIVPPGASARYVRITITSPQTDVGLSEVEVFGIIAVR